MSTGSSSKGSSNSGRRKQDRYGSVSSDPVSDNKTPKVSNVADLTTGSYVLADNVGEKDGLMKIPVSNRRNVTTSSRSEVADTLLVSESEVEEINNMVPENQQSPMSDGAASFDSDGSDDSDDGYEMSIQELLYSSSSYYAIAKPVTLTMVLAALAVVYVNNEATIANGEAAMASAYQVWNVDSAENSGQSLAMSLANALVMVSVICGMTFVIVLLYKLKFMKCLIGYMVMCSGTLLGILGGNLLATAISIYNVTVDKFTFYFFMINFAFVGVLSVFWGQGTPKYITQGYLIATSVILAWHLSYFDDWTTWTLLFMLALYDLCAVLTPCGPLKALVNLMSQEDAPEMPGLLFEADLPPEAKRPGDKDKDKDKDKASRRNSSSGSRAGGSVHSNPPPAEGGENKEDKPVGSAAFVSTGENAGRHIRIPLAIAKVYQLPVISIPDQSKSIMYPNRTSKSNNVSASPLLADGPVYDESVSLPENPSPEQLRALVQVRLPPNGGSIEHVSKRGKKVYLERDRHGNPKRILWVDRNGKVFAEMREDDEDGPERNSIRLGLGDFIFYSVLVAKAAQYSFATFAACMLVILSGLGGTLVLLSVYHHALPALPISIFLGVVFYVMTRLFTEPWVEAVLSQPYYV